jgi:hypothetical protein
MFESIYEAEDYVLDFDVYTDFSIKSIAHRDFGGVDGVSNERDDRKVIFQVESHNAEVRDLSICYRDGEEVKATHFEFRYVFSFVISVENLYIGAEIIDLNKIIDISVGECF